MTRVPSSPGAAESRRLDEPPGEADVVYRTIFAVVLNERTAAALLHQTFVQALEQQRESSVRERRMWLIGIAVDLALGHEDAANRNLRLGRWRGLTRHAAGTDPVRTLLGPLTPGMRAMVVLHHYHRLHADDIATMIDVAFETVRVQLSMAIELMRDHLPPASAPIAVAELDREIVEALCDGLDGTSARLASRPARGPGRADSMAGGAPRRLLALTLAAAITSVTMAVAANTLVQTNSSASRGPLPTSRASATPLPAPTSWPRSSPAVTETPRQYRMPSLAPARGAAPQPTSSVQPAPTAACRSHDPHRCH